MTAESFWLDFLTQTGRSADTPLMETFHFDLTEEWADKLLALVLSGQKQATASSLWAFERSGSRPPQSGDLSIVTDWAGEPRCVIETTAVTVLPFREMTYEICRREGEDDSLASWKAGHTRFFTREGEALGYAFSEDMPVVFEDFRVVWPE